MGREGGTKLVSVGLDGDQLIVDGGGEAVGVSGGLLLVEDVHGLGEGGLDGVGDVVDDGLGIGLGDSARGIRVGGGLLDVVVELLGSAQDGDGRAKTTAVVVGDGSLELLVVRLDDLEVSEDLSGIALDNGSSDGGGKDGNAGDEHLE